MWSNTTPSLARSIPRLSQLPEPLRKEPFQKELYVAKYQPGQYLESSRQPRLLKEALKQQQILGPLSIPDLHKMGGYLQPYHHLSAKKSDYQFHECWAHLWSLLEVYNPVVTTCSTRCEVVVEAPDHVLVHMAVTIFQDGESWALEMVENKGHHDYFRQLWLAVQKGFGIQESYMSCSFGVIGSDMEPLSPMEPDANASKSEAMGYLVDMCNSSFVDIQQQGFEALLKCFKQFPSCCSSKISIDQLAKWSQTECGDQVWSVVNLAMMNPELEISDVRALVKSCCESYGARYPNSPVSVLLTQVTIH